MLRNVFVVAGAIAVALWSHHALAVPIVADGGFESPADSAYGAPASPPWTSNDGVYIDPLFPHSGGQDAALGDNYDLVPPGPGELSQTVATTTGQDYTLDFWLFDEAGDPADSFTVTLGTFSLTITGDEAPGAYTEFTPTIAGSDLSGNETLSFSATNLNSEWHLDDISLTPITTSVPEPSSISLLGAAMVALLLVLGVRSRLFQM
jgi:hypothetical protein